MSLLKWDNEKLSIGIPLIDNQHKMLVHLINQLANGINNKEHKADIDAIYTQLQDYTNYHFTTEETYFFRLNTADTTKHALQHKNFIKQLSQFKNNHQEVTHSSTELLQFLSDWLVHHIQIEDKKFAQDYIKGLS